MIWWWLALADFFASVQCEWTRSEITTHTLADTPEYPLPSDVREVVAAYVYDGSTWTRLQPLDYEQFLEMPHSSTGTSPTHYYAYRNQIGIYPTPASSSYESHAGGDITDAAHVGAEEAYSTLVPLGTNAQYQGFYVDITAPDGTTQTMRILSHTNATMKCLPVNASTGAVGTWTDIETALLAAPLEFEIWTYIENLKILYTERPPIPNENSARGMGSVTDGEAAAAFLYDVPEEYFAILLAYVLSMACTKDKLTRDAAAHKNTYDVGVARAQRTASHRLDDSWVNRRSRRGFEAGQQHTFGGDWWRTSHNV